MAATLAAPTLHLPQHNTDAYPYGARRTMPDTPPSSASPEDAVDPRKLYRPGPGNFVPSVQYRQIRPMRQPLSVPAALRAETLNQIRPLDTPPNSQENKFKEAKVESEDEDSVDEDELETEEVVAEQPHKLSEQQQMKVKMETLYRTLGPRAKRELQDEEIAHVTDMPTTAHWKRDESSKVCKLCEVPFTFWTRRHHCRHCGELVCWQHALDTVRLDQNAHYHKGGHTVRGCDVCVVEYKTVCTLRKMHEQAMLNAGPTSVTPPIETRSQREERFLNGISIAASVGGVEWSTF